MNDAYLTSHVHKFIENNQLIKEGDKIIVALSGGPDSVFLLHTLHLYQQKKNIILVAAHLDHEWRKKSAHDAAFCEELCKKWAIPYVQKKCSELKTKPKYNGSKEEFGRLSRRLFLQEQCQLHQAQSIALGHHSNDQEETFFIRLIRGTTLSGIVSMKTRQENYIRPLLNINKSSIIAYLEKNNIPYCIDETNASNNFLRNQIRHQIIPLLHAVDSRFEKNFFRCLLQLQRTESFLERLCREHFKQTTFWQNDVCYLKLDLLKEIDQFLQRRIILLWLIAHKISFTPTEKFIEEIYRFFYTSKQKSHAIHLNWFLVKQNGMASILLISSKK